MLLKWVVEVLRHQSHNYAHCCQQQILGDPHRDHHFVVQPNTLLCFRGSIRTSSKNQFQMHLAKMFPRLESVFYQDHQCLPSYNVECCMVYMKCPVGILCKQEHPNDTSTSCFLYHRWVLQDPTLAYLLRF